MTKVDWLVSLPAQLGGGEEPSGFTLQVGRALESARPAYTVCSSYLFQRAGMVGAGHRFDLPHFLLYLRVPQRTLGGDVSTNAGRGLLQRAGPWQAPKDRV